MRRELVGDLTGRVLEIGCGTGTMFKYYGSDAQVEAIEPEADFLALARRQGGSVRGGSTPRAGDGMQLAVRRRLVRRGGARARAVQRAVGGAGARRELPRPQERRAAAGARARAQRSRRLRLPDGRDQSAVAAPQRQGCNWNRNPIDEIEAAGFRVDDVMAFKRFDTVMPAFPMRRVRAHKG